MLVPKSPPPLSPLPIDETLPRLAAALRDAGAAVVRAPTGAGKTTRVPPAVAALLDALTAEHRQVVMLEPRRIAARAAARRMAEENGWRLGAEVGYQVRFDRRAGKATRILVVTEGILVQRLQADPFLDGVGAVLFDELHERSLQADLALAMARRVRREVRPDLRLVAMSATLDPAPLQAFLGAGGEPCPSIESEGFLHSVEIDWLDPTDRRLRAVGATPGSARPSDVAALAAHGVRRMIEAVDGDVLCFLPGVGEIHRVAEALAPLAGDGLLVARLYGDLPPAEQDAVLSPDRSSASRRRVVLATNVAETSVTIEGIEGVVDSGWARVLRFDPGSGLDRLDFARISRASAAQRTGRAGRLGPGRCLRLWSEHEHRGLPERDTPEIARVDLAGAALELLAWGETDLAAFPWFEAPEPAALAASLDLLRRLGAVGPQGVTELGRAMAALPAHPRLGAPAARRPPPRTPAPGGAGGGPARRALPAAPPPRQRAAPPLPLRPPRRRRGGGALRRRRRLDRGTRARRRPLRPARPRPARRPRYQTLSPDPLDDHRPPPPTSPEPVEGRGPATPPDPSEAVLRAVLAAYPDRVCRRREPGSPRAVMVGGRGVELADRSAVRDAGSSSPSSWPTAVDRRPVPKRGCGSPPRSSATGCRPSGVTTATELVFDAERRRVLAHRRTRYDDLVLAEDEVPITADLEPDASRTLAAAAAADLAAALPLDEAPVAPFLARLRSLAAWRRELALPRFTDAELAALLPALADGRRSFAELRRAPLLDVLRGLLDHRQLRALEREARSGWRYRAAATSASFTSRAGRRCWRCASRRCSAPTTPARRRRPRARPPPPARPEPAPAAGDGRPRHFSRNTYPEVRKELAGRYPKHAWPEDPLTAVPRRRPGRTRARTQKR